MYDYIHGILTKADPIKIILDIQGLGYRLFIPLSTYEKLPSIGSKVKFFVTLIIREDAHKIFGFLTEEERDLFVLLIEISGIGPRLAIAILGHMTKTDLYLAIEQNNAKAISQIPGIGKKMAERLILELGDKLHVKGGKPSLLPLKAGIAADAISALTNLGYHPAEAHKVVQSILLSEKEKLELSQVITQALKTLK